MRKTISGFTIVELLIVIVVIGILAAITIVAYNGVQSRAKAAGVQSDLTTAKKKLMLWQVDNGHYPTTTAELTAAGMQFTHSFYDSSANNLTYCADTTADQFALGGQVASSNTSYFVSSVGGLQEGSAGARASQVCGVLGTAYPATGIWAVNGYNTTNGWTGWASQ